MDTNTTINMHANIMEKINLASDITGKSRSKIIIMLLMKFLAHNNTRVKTSGTVRYQSRDSKHMWRPFHITYSQNEYEYFQDLRRMLKMTLSLALAYAVNEYLDKILIGKDTDIYQFQNYRLTRKVVKGEITWNISWGKPEIIKELANINTS